MNALARWCLVLLAVFPGVAAAQWRYTTQVDRMTSGRVEYAEIESVNSLSLDFPYKGENRGRIYVRKGPKAGTDVMIQIDKGQIKSCRINPCTAMIRFDSDAPVAMQGVGPSDGSSNTMFLTNVPGFLARARKAKTILVELTIFSNGQQILEFSPHHPLVWK